MPAPSESDKAFLLLALPPRLREVSCVLAFVLGAPMNVPDIQSSRKAELCGQSDTRIMVTLERGVCNLFHGRIQCVSCSAFANAPLILIQLDCNDAPSIECWNDARCVSCSHSARRKGSLGGYKG